MPHYEMDPEIYRETFGKAPPSDSGEYYEPAEATVPAAGGTLASRLTPVLLAAGVTRVVCNYDGGYDEGFAYFDHAETAAGKLDQVQLAALIDATSEAVALHDEERSNICYGEAHKPTVGERLLEEYIFDLSTLLLGKGYGTGECELRGRFVFDLVTRQIVDIK